MRTSKTILFVYSHWQSFVREDFHMLSDDFLVKKLQFSLKKGLFSFFYFQLKGALQLFFKMKDNDVAYIWFCDYHAFWAVLMAKFWKKKAVIVVGGFDAVKIPSIQYGLFMKEGIRTRLARFAYKKCDLILVVDDSLIASKNTFAGVDSITGVANFVEGVKSKTKVVPTGYDPNKWKISAKKQQVLSIALIKDQKVFDRKGIELFLQVAKNLPNIPFILIGLQDQNLIPESLRNLPNLTIHPIVPQEELIEIYAETQVYVQFSVSEGLPNVLCEAMMSGCIPVGSSANGIPNAIGDCGYVLNQPDAQIATNLVISALNDPLEKGLKARERIINLFPKELRKKTLNQLIQDL